MNENFEAVVQLVDETGFKVEMTAGMPTWEAFPGMRHQKAIVRLLSSIVPIPGHQGTCGCFYVTDAYLRFSDGSIKRPDVAIFCEEPPDVDEAVEMLPAAVVEVLSKGYERKDIEVSAPFYLQAGVLDVILFDPRTAAVTHLRRDGEQHLTSPVTLDLECGCRITV